MEERINKISSILTRFIVELTRGIESFEFNNVKIGTGIILIYHIGTNKTSTMSDLASYMRVIPSTATRRVDKLVTAGLVRRKNTDDDRRMVSLELTREGINYFNKFAETRAKALQQLTSSFTEEEIDTFFDVLDEVRG